MPKPKVRTILEKTPVKITFHAPFPLYREVRILAAQQNTSAQDLWVVAMQRYLNAHEWETKR